MCEEQIITDQGKANPSCIADQIFPMETKTQDKCTNKSMPDFINPWGMK